MATKETQVLWWCLRRRQDHPGDEMSFSGFDRDKLIYAVNCARAEGFLYRRICELPDFAKYFSEGSRRSLQERYYATFAKTTYLLHTLRDVAIQLQRENIDCIVFKGAHLLEEVYADIGLRPVFDIDLLLRQEDTFRAVELLRQRGFHIDGGGVLPKEGRIENNYRNSILMTLREGLPVYLHLHWNPVNVVVHDPDAARRFASGDIWRRARPGPNNTGTLKVFSHEHQLVYLSFHALQHSFHPLVLLCDINEYISVHRHMLDWDGVVCQAEEWGLSGYLYLALSLSERMLGTAIPRQVIVSLSPGRMSVFERCCLQSAMEASGYRVPAGIVEFGMCRSISEKLSFLFRSLAPSRQEMSLVSRKDIGEISLRDYLRRFSTACLLTAKFIFVWFSLFNAIIRNHLDDKKSCYRR